MTNMENTFTQKTINMRSEQDGQGGYDHRDGHDAAQADPEENYEGKNQEQNDVQKIRDEPVEIYPVQTWR